MRWFLQMGDAKFILKKFELSLTDARVTILNHFLGLGCKEFSAEDISKKMENDLATIYRNLEKMEKSGILESRFEKDRKFFSLSSKISKHHHFKCVKCEILFPVECSDEMSFNLPSGFKILDHKIEIFGICKDCDNS